ncbi:MAG: efflux RND transporter periplasmic adaptor subunit [Clostridia bacterium]|nr:efflux RND transporter periplasmic adaptor subunit [Clostridia bacterium]
MSSEQVENENIIEKKRRIEKIKKKKGRKKILIFLIVIIAFFAISGYSKNSSGEVKSKFNYEEVTADSGDINVIVEGKGTIEENRVYNIYPTVNGEIIEDYIVVGQNVNKDDLLYVIDSEDLDASLSTAKLAVEQAQINYNNIRKQISDLTIVSNDNGHISDLTISKGAYVTNAMQICNVVEKNQYEVVLQFANSTASPIRVGNRATLTYISYLSNVEGVVTNVSDRNFLLADGSQVVEVTIRVETTGYSLTNAQVKGTIYTDAGTAISSANTAFVTGVTNNMVKAKSMGTVKEVYVKNGDYVNTGAVIAILENTDLQTSLSNAQIALKNAKNSLSNVEKQLENYYITSPISGTIAYKNNKLGDIISNFQSASSNIMVTVVDNSIKKFEMEVDELDIAKVKVGQEVEVTIDALEGKEFVGTVANINTIGKTTAGITTYTVLIELESNSEIYAGMNVDASIKITSINDVIRVPLSAVRKGNVVYRKVADVNYQDADSKVPMGYEKVSVEIGQNNSDYIEIISGIKEGDVVLIDKLTQSGILDFSHLQGGM